MDDVTKVTYVIGVPLALSRKIEEAAQDSRSGVEAFIHLAIAEKLSREEHEAWLLKKHSEGPF